MNSTPHTHTYNQYVCKIQIDRVALDLGRQAKKEEGGNPDKADTDMVPSACFS